MIPLWVKFFLNFDQSYGHVGRFCTLLIAFICQFVCNAFNLFGSFTRQFLHYMVYYFHFILFINFYFIARVIFLVDFRLIQFVSVLLVGSIWWLDTPDHLHSHFTLPVGICRVYRERNNSGAASVMASRVNPFTAEGCEGKPKTNNKAAACKHSVIKISPALGIRLAYNKSLPSHGLCLHFSRFEYRSLCDALKWHCRHKGLERNCWR